MDNNLAALINKYNQSHEMLVACQMAMQEIYPDLRLRWSRIYGSRWAHLGGSYQTDFICFNPVRVRINDEYGIFIENPELLADSKLEEIIKTLKECWTHALS